MNNTVFVFLFSLLMSAGVCLASSIGVVAKQCGLESLAVSMSLIGSSQEGIKDLLVDTPNYVSGSNQMSLAKLSEISERYRLQTNGYKVNSLSSLRDSIDNENHVYIVHLKSDDAADGHFVVLSKAPNPSKGKYLFVGYPDLIYVNKLEDFNLFSDKGYCVSGAVLRVEKRDVIKEKDSEKQGFGRLPRNNNLPCVIKIEADANLDKMQASCCYVKDDGADILSAKILIRNDMHDELKIKQIASDCSCFKNASHSDEFASLEVIEAVVSFNADKLRLVQRNMLIVSLLVGDKECLVKVPVFIVGGGEYYLSRRFGDDSNIVNISVIAPSGNRIVPSAIKAVTDDVLISRVSDDEYAVIGKSGLFGKEVTCIIDSHEYTFELSGMQDVR